MQFPTLTGKTYRIEYTDDLTSTSGTPSPNPIPGDGNPVIVEDPAATNLPRISFRTLRGSGYVFGMAQMLFVPPR